MRFPLLLLLALLAACDGAPAPRPPITVFAAASLARPLAILADSFQSRTGVPVRRELGGSLDHVRKLTDLNRIPDVLMLADDEIMASLMPAHLDWYVRFATSRIVLAYTDQSRFADSITTENWWRLITRDGVSVGRADSAIAPAGRHALAILRRAESYYREPGLTDRLLARSGQRHVRPNATELAALLETGEVDYVLEYEAVSRQYGFRFLRLPADLALAVLYGIAVPRRAPDAASAEAFVTYVLSREGKAILADANMEVLRVPVALGSPIPSDIASHVRTIATDSPR